MTTTLQGQLGYLPNKTTQKNLLTNKIFYAKVTTAISLPDGSGYEAKT
jgi:hypothetical protein